MRTVAPPTRLLMLLLSLALVVGAWKLAQAVQRQDDGRDIGAGLTDAEEEALYASLGDRAAQEQQAAARDFVARGGDPRALRQVARPSVVSLPPQTLEEAASAASRVVRGRVVQVDFAPASQAEAPGSLAQVEVYTIDGQRTPETLTILQPATLEMDLENPGKLALSVASYAPALFEGDEVFLLLGQEFSSGRYFMLAYVGGYKVGGGKLLPVEGDPFGEQMKLLSPQAAMEQVEAARR